MKSNFPQSAFCFLQRLSAIFNGFLLSSMAFRFLQRLSNFFNGFPIFLNSFPLSKKSEKSIYGSKYTKDHHSSFVFTDTCSPSFVIATSSPSFIIATRSPSFVIATRSPSFVIATMRASHPTVDIINTP
jgi:hypothetical protein